MEIAGLKQLPFNTTLMGCIAETLALERTAESYMDAPLGSLASRRQSPIPGIHNVLIRPGMRV